MMNQIPNLDPVDTILPSTHGQMPDNGHCRSAAELSSAATLVTRTDLLILVRIAQSIAVATLLLATIPASAQGPQADITISAASMPEKGGTSTIEVSYKYASVTGYLSYVLTGSTATPDTDFKAGALYSLDDLSASLIVTAIDDTIYNPGETVRLTFFYTATLFGDPTVTVEVGTAVVTITDDESPPSISLSSSSTTVSESGSSVSVTARLSAASPLEVSVDYATADGSALAGSDYESDSGTLQFSAGETEKSIRLNVKEDTLDEANETFEVRLREGLNNGLHGP